MGYMGTRTNDVKCKPCNWCTEYTERRFEGNVLKGEKTLYCMNEKEKHPQYGNCFRIGGGNTNGEGED